MLMDHRDIARQISSRAIGVYNKRHDKQRLRDVAPGTAIIKGLLFGCGSDNPLLVPLPIRNEASTPPRVGDVDTSGWLQPTYIRPFFLEHVNNNILERSLMSTFIVFSYRQHHGPPNIRNNSSMTRLSSPAIWWGDLLVLKLHDENVVDVDVEDVSLIKQLLVW